MRRRHCLLIVLFVLSSSCKPARHAAPSLIIWAWERPEDLRFVGGAAEVAVQSGFVEIAGDRLITRGRRYPLFVTRPPSIALVHIQIDPSVPLAWTIDMRRRVAAAVLHFATRIPAPTVQIDFEVRASQRHVLLDLLHDTRRALPSSTRLSMTALASWCENETWLDAAPVDEIVPMLFRMGRGDEIIRNRLEAGGDFRHPRCRTAFGIATDAPVRRAPLGRRVYLFNPRSWTRHDLAVVQGEVETWR